jgi:dihydropteroate synthase
MFWRTAHHTFDLRAHGVIMGILNVTPDSFSDGGSHPSVETAVERAMAMMAEGAAIIDIGGESTRPGAEPVAEAEEMRRVLPVVEALAARAPGCVISVDTSKAAVAREAMARGASIINDVTALRGDPPAMAAVAAETGAGVVLMHMQGDPRTMQRQPHYENVTAEVRAFFEERFQFARAAGIDAECIAFDPGIGFGKTAAHNLTILRELGQLSSVADRPLALGVSRKGFLAKASGVETMTERLWPTVALTALGREKGARVLRVHEVGPNVAALRMAEALQEGAPSS